MQPDEGWPAAREIESYRYPVWLTYPAGMLEGARLLDASPHHISVQETARICQNYEFLVLFTSTVGWQRETPIMFSIFALIHGLLNLIAIGAGATVLFGLLTGELLRKWSICFLETSLFASISSFTFSAHHLRPAEGHPWRPHRHIRISTVC